jgi:hypothetical protein
LPLLVALAVAAAGNTTAEDARKQSPDLRYLDPAKIRELPAAVRADLAKLGCRVPSFTKWDAKHNVIQGQFFEAGRQDWAVLCQIGDKTGILLYPGGGATELPMLHPQPNDPARTIHAVSAFVMTKRALRDHPDETPSAFDHDGIEDGPIQKAGRVLYYRDGEWTEL